MKPSFRLLYLRPVILVFLPFLLNSCGSSSSTKTPPPPVTFTIGGTVSNLVGTGLVLQDNGGNNLSAAANGSFTFTTAIDSGDAYAVTVLTQPSNPAQTCTVASGSGTASANVTNVTVNCGHNEWAWMSGSNTPNHNGTYGTQGTAAAGNIPGARTFAISWTDTSGNLWLFGGFGLDSAGTSGGGELNDLWKYNISSGQWTWISGSNLIGQAGVYGTLGTPATSNVPGARDSSATWIDATGNLWLFGGASLDSGGNLVYLNDLWKYSVTGGEWTWLGGSNATNQAGTYGTEGTAAAGNVPGARVYPAVWISSGNVFLFGGSGYDMTGISTGYLNDLWKYSISSGEWTWIGGSNTFGHGGTYGTLGIAALANIPGGRVASVSWIDSTGNFWLFGGTGFDSVPALGFLNDLWKYNTISGEWSWAGGPNLDNQNGTYGTKGTAAQANVPGGRSNASGWTDASGNFWLFGGSGLDSAGTNAGAELNDLWEYSTSSGEWAWINGPNIANGTGTYGTLGALAPGNIPGSRDSSVSWTDSSGHFWLFGGESGANNFNDLWMYMP
jgi:hypothetical protein